MSGELGALGQRYFGVFLGTVIDVDDPDDLGRIRLENDQYDDTADDPTWAAVVRPLAGDVSSVFFSPKPGDQVVFAFLAGDVRQPIVLGYAHTTDRKPATPSGTRQTIVVKDVGSITFIEGGDRTIEIDHASGACVHISNSAVEVRADDSSFIRVAAGTIEVVGATVKLGNATVVAGPQGVLTGETIDMFTGKPFWVIGGSSAKVAAVKVG